MFRLLTYYLGMLLGAAAAFSLLGIMQYDVVDLLASAGFLVAVAWLSNYVFSRLWKVPTNIESSIITGLILSLIITPDKPDQQLFFLAFAAIFAIGSKYLLAIRGKHVFNPAAFGVAMTALVLGRSASWWVAGNLALLTFVLAGGILIVRKTHRTDLVLSYIVATLLASIAYKLSDPAAVWSTLQTTVLHTSLLFFAFVMITEPLTTPPRRLQRIAYGAIVGVLSAPWVHIGSFYFTPELALLAGNIFSYGVSPTFKSLLRFSGARKLAADTYEFVFEGPVPHFTPGQYAEFTIGTDRADNRGNRRYFTLASSPTEHDIKLGIKFYADSSTFKSLLARFTRGDHLLAGSIAGDFVLPRDERKKLVFVAGGIGITPFRSIIKYLIDTHQRRDIILFYSNKTEAEIAYRDIFDEAQRLGIGLRVIYTLTGEQVPTSWNGERGYVDEAMIRRFVPDFADRYYYVSGPHAMVESFSRVLSAMGVSRVRMHKDFFPGFV